MRKAGTIARREIYSHFITPLAYVLMAGFTLVSGFFFFYLVQNFNSVLQKAGMLSDENPGLNPFVVTPFFQSLQIVLVFLIPILTMRSIADEKRTGTFELLSTSPLTVNDIVLGKFLGISAIVVLILTLSFLFPLSLIVVADPEAPPAFVGFFGCVLFGVSFVAIGVAVSAFTKSQTVAGVMSLVVLLLLYLVDVPAPKVDDRFAAFLYYLAPSHHLESFARGVIQGADIVYFLSLTAVGLFVANRVLDAERWR